MSSDDTGAPPPPDTPEGRFAAAASLATWILRQRRKREEILGAHHFSDPNWDIMLDLFAARVRGEDVATSSLIVAANVPQSTALRRIRQLIRGGDLIARGDPRDRRRTYVRISDELFQKIGYLLQQWHPPKN